MSLTPGSIAAILPAAGKSRRFGGEEKKIFAPLGSCMVWEHAVRRLRNRPEVGRILIAIDPDDAPMWQGICREALDDLGVETVRGGLERADSVAAALALVDQEAYVAVHDAARPLVRDGDLAAVFLAAAERGAALLASPLRGTIKRQNFAQQVSHTVDRRDLWEALTPQVFRIEWIRDAYRRWRGFPVTDDAQLVERAGHPVCLVEGSPTNLKITVADDLRIAAALLAAEQPESSW